MKIALVNHTFSLSHGGLERSSVNLATALLQAGHEVHVYASHYEDLPEGVIVHKVKYARKPSFWRVFSFARNVRRALNMQHFDLVYGFTRSYGLDVYRLGDGVHRHWMRLNYPLRPWRWVNYLVNPVHLANLYMENSLLGKNRLQGIVTNSKLVKKHICQYYPIDEDKIKVVYNGVDHGTFNTGARTQFRAQTRRELGLQTEDKVLLHVSNNWKRKGLDVLLRAVAQLSKDGERVHVLVVGRGRRKPYMLKAKACGMDVSNLHFVGATDRIVRYYAASDVFVLPTMYDPFANVCLEALSCGLPVVTTSENGAAEAITPGVNGYVQKNQQDADELRLLLSQCLADSTLQKMSADAAVSTENFTLEKNLADTLAACER